MITGRIFWGISLGNYANELWKRTGRGQKVRAISAMTVRETQYVGIKPILSKHYMLCNKTVLVLFILLRLNKANKH